MEFIKLSQEVVDISKKLESLSKKIVNCVHNPSTTVKVLPSHDILKSKPEDLPPAGIVSHNQQISMMWQQTLRTKT